MKFFASLILKSIPMTSYGKFSMVFLSTTTCKFLARNYTDSK
jgi:hypothetical protein